MQNFEIKARIKELQDQLAQVKSEEDILHVQLRNRINEVKEVQSRRDELNRKVKELSRKPKEILEDRKEIWDDIKETNRDKKKIFSMMQPYLQRIGELRKIRDAYNSASRGTLDKLQDQYDSTMTSLMGSDINLKSELYLYGLLFDIRDRMVLKREADSVHTEIVRIKEKDLSCFNRELNGMEDVIGQMKERSHEELETAKSFWSERDSIREKAQKEHERFLEINSMIKDIKRDIGRKKKERRGIINRIDDWRKEFKKSHGQRVESDKARRLEEARKKYKRGESLSLDEMGLLLESGELK